MNRANSGPIRSPNAIRNVGIALFVLSFVVPCGRIMQNPFHLFMGLWTFINTPFLVFFQPLFCPLPGEPSYEPVSLLHSIVWYGLSLGAWSTNFTVFVRLPLVAALITIAVPWAAFIWLFPVLSDFVPFYFWACGITAIHLSRIRKPLPLSS